MSCHTIKTRKWPLFFLYFFHAFSIGEVLALGVNWGTQASHPLSPQTVVRLLRDNGIKKVKLFDSDSSVLRALANSGIDVMVAIPNESLRSMTDATQANFWVQNNVVRYIPIGTRIRYVAVGNEPFLQAYNGTFLALTYPALRNIQQALNNAGVNVKATVPLNADVLSTASTPSSSTFRSDIQGIIMQILALLAENDCPFILNVYPFLSLYMDKNFPVEYAFFDRHASPVVDNQYTYYNVFDASYDSLVVALTKAGYGSMSIIIGEIGWPTDGDVNANMDYARRFNQGFVSHATSNEGTPRRPGAPIEFYLFDLLDEDMKSIAPGNFERHWGIFRYDGKPKYTLSLGTSSSSGLVQAQGVRYLPSQWCVLDTNATDRSTLADSVSYACANADCTALGYGCSCNNYLDANGNASYAFNAYFQRQSQEAGACYFNGLGRIVTSNPSINRCEFIVQIANPSGSSAATSDARTLLAVFPAYVMMLIIVFLM